MRRLKGALSATTRPGGSGLTLKALTGLSSIALLSQILRLCVIPDPDLERVCGPPGAGLLDHHQDEGCRSVSPDFLVSLALNCHLNEFVWAETDVEREKLQQLEQVMDDGARTFAQVACLASYRSLAAYPWSAEVAEVPNCQAIFETMWRRPKRRLKSGRRFPA